MTAYANFIRAFVLGHPLVALAFSGFWSAFSVDLFHFLQWKSWNDATQWDWRTATLKWVQGTLGNVVGMTVTAGAAAGASAAVGTALLYFYFR